MQAYLQKIKLLLLCVLVVALGGIGAAALSGQRAETAAASPRADAASVRLQSQTSPDVAEAASGAAAADARPEPVKAESAARLAPTDAAVDAVNTPAADGQSTRIGAFSVPASKLQSVRANTAVNGALDYSGDLRAYAFTLTDRGVMQIGFSFGVSEVAGTPWIVYLYEAYASAGSGPNDAYRLITKLNVSSAATDTVKTEKTGLYPGDYVMLVCTGDAYSAASYTLAAAFVANTAWEAEPNDTQTRYNELAFGVKTGGTSANNTFGDTDWFLIELPARGLITVDFEHADLQSVSVGWFVTLLDSDGNVLYRARSYQRDTIVSSGEIGLEQGVYYIRVESHILVTEDYYITCNYSEYATYETEPNDTPATADPLTVNDSQGGVSGSLSEKDDTPDRDYYRFDLATDGVISFRFIHRDDSRPRDGWTIRLLDADGEEIYQTVSRWNDMSVSSPQIGLRAGRYYILVDGENMLLNSGTYVIGVTFAGGTNWESERNDTPQTANPIALNTETFGTLVNSGLYYDTDYYTFTLDRVRAVSLSFAHESMSGDSDGWVVSLTDADGREITSFLSAWSDKTVSSGMVNLAPGTYFIRVDTGSRFSAEKYGLTVNAK